MDEATNDADQPNAFPQPVAASPTAPSAAAPPQTPDPVQPPVPEPAITEPAANHPPRAADLEISVDEDGAVALNLLRQARDPNGDLLSLRWVTQGDHGTASFDATGLTVYWPHRDYSGPDRFVYEVCDPAGLCARGLVLVEVVAVNDLILAAADPVAAVPASAADLPAFEAVTDAAGEAAANLVAPAGLLTLVAAAALAKGSTAASLLSRLLGLLSR